MGDDVQALKLVKSIEENTKHYVEILSRAIDDCMPEPASEVTYVSFPAQEEGKTEGKQSIRIDLITASRTTSWMY